GGVRLPDTELHDLAPRAHAASVPRRADDPGARHARQPAGGVVDREGRASLRSRQGADRPHARHAVQRGVRRAAPRRAARVAQRALLLGAEVAAVSETRTFPPEQDGGPAPAAQWVGLLLAPAVFAAHLQITYVLVRWACLRNADLWVHVVDVLAVLLAALGTF